MKTRWRINANEGSRFAAETPVPGTAALTEERVGFRLELPQCRIDNLYYRYAGYLRYSYIPVTSGTAIYIGYLRYSYIPVTSGTLAVTSG